MNKAVRRDKVVVALLRCVMSRHAPNGITNTIKHRSASKLMDQLSDRVLVSMAKDKSQLSRPASDMDVRLLACR